MTVALPDLLAQLCPMHALLSPTGHIRHTGPTLRKLRPGLELNGRRFLEVFEVQRPRGVTDMAGLLALAGRKLHLRLRDAPRTQLKGVLVPDPSGGAIVDLSFGFAVVDAVRSFDLTSSDFAPTDLAVEMLYLVEAQNAAMTESRKLNLRLQGARIAAEEQAFTDTLTGLRNRRALDHVLARLTDAGRPFALMHVDLDYFKAVNDRLGHAAGDFVLQNVAQILTGETRQNDIAARLGGDEFVVIVDGAQDRRTLADIAARIIIGLERPLDFGGQPCRISGSIGIACAPGTAATPEALMAAADAALYTSKRAGRGRHTFFEPGMAMDPGDPASSSGPRQAPGVTEPPGTRPG
ncbi:diguanylate cyclase domain-containing protein [Thalassococcus sp. BH17M4-6]|uniref:diguanylate cyclase domain-containing protein n=1 Tax=Thalassococcus sp. BH17M4-6 TaxID=3413148 RepID=UPI003BC5E651